MHRLQISLTKSQYEFLKSEAFVSGKSMAAILRNLLDEIIDIRRQNMLKDDPIWNVIGVGEEVEGPTDVSTNVDKHLYGASLEPAAHDQQLQRVAEESDEYDTD